MSDTGNFLDGRSLLTGSPFRSVYFLIASSVGAGSIATCAYLLYRHGRALTAYPAMFLSALVGLQLIYQWWRAVRYYGRIRELYAEASAGGAKEGTQLDIAVRVAAGGMIDLLFFSYGIALAALILVGFLLSRIDGLK